MLATKRLIEQTGARVMCGVTVVNLKYLNQADLSEVEIISLLEIEND
jgi:hypothetical protein